MIPEPELTITYPASDWERIKSPAADQIVSYDDLPATTDPKSLNRLAVLKVNGGLGTSMGMRPCEPKSPSSSDTDVFCFLGMTGAKSALEVKDDMTFLDLTVRQIEHLNTTYRVDVPLILMTSFNTHDDTLRIIKKYANQQLRITTFNQSRYPRIDKETLLPLPRSATDDKSKWYPPGHGDLYNALMHSGVLDQLLAEGKEYLFVSNSDNLGAVVDQKILQHMIDTNAEFIMEVTDKTKADVKVWERSPTVVYWLMHAVPRVVPSSTMRETFNCSRSPKYRRNTSRTSSLSVSSESSTRTTYGST